MIQIHFAAGPARWPAYEAPLHNALSAAGITARVGPVVPPAEADYVIYAPTGTALDFGQFPRARAVLSLWAGVESIIANPTLTQPLTRMSDEGLRRGMTEWICGHVLRHHLGMDAHILGQDGQWRSDLVPPLAPDRPVALLGLGALGAAAAQALGAFGFDLRGWSRRPKDLPGLRCYAGPEGLVRALTGAQIVVLLLPDTPATQNILNAERLALLAPGAAVINPGRGALIDDAALLAALDSGQVGQATLDVFRTEPLPPEHPYWAHPRVTVTPHIASETRPSSAAALIVENIRRSEAGAPLLHLVDRQQGY